MDLKSELLKEAMQRTSKLEKISSVSNISSTFTVETLQEFDLRKESSLQKLAMPVAQGQLKLRNSSSNLKWWVVKPEGRVQQIVEEIKAAFRPFFFAVGKNGKRQKIDPKAYFPNGGFSPSNEREAIPGEPQCSLRVEFGFSRQIIPTDKEFGDVAQKSIKTINSTLQGFQNFINDIGNSRLTLNPFFHKISPSRAAGTLISKTQVEEFLQNENQRYKSAAITLPDGKKLNTSNFFDKQMMDISNGISAYPTMTDSFDRIYDNEEHLNSIHDPMPLCRAVLQKIRQGYSIDENKLKEVISQEKNIKASAIHKEQQNARFGNIINLYKNALKTLKSDENPDNYEILWEDRKNQKIYRGFKVIGNKNAKKPVGLEVNDLRLMLRSLINHGPGVEKTFLYPDQFSIPGASMKYQSNGWDSHPMQLGKTMTMLPSIRNINNKLEYDFDQINLGRIHLSMYGNEVKTILQKYGPNCKQWFEKIQNGKIANTMRNDINQVPFESIDHIIGFQALKRTNAETLAENLAQFKDFKSLQSRLQYSMSSQIRGTDAIKSSQNSFIDEECFNLLKQYGYYVAKMMDLASGIMHRSCKEGLQTRVKNQKGSFSIVPESFYGRRYSTSGGKAQHGKVVVGIRYAFNSVELGSHDLSLQRIVRDKRGKRQWARPQPGQPEVVRQTQNFQQGDVVDQNLQPNQEGSIIKLVENMQFWIGISSSDSDFKKTVAVADDWPSLLAKLHQLYPNLDNEDGLAIFDPININIKKLQNAVSGTIAATLKELESQQFEDEVEVVIQQYDGNIKVADAEPDLDHSLEIEEIENQQNQQINAPSNVKNVEIQEPATVAPQQNVQQKPPQINNTQKQPAINTKNVAPNKLKNTQSENSVSLEKPGVDKQKSFPLPVPDYIHKKKPMKRLFRKGIDPNTSKIQRAEVIENLIKVANRLDLTGDTATANKLDILIKKLSKE